MADERDNKNSEQEYSFPEKSTPSYGQSAHSGGTEDILSLLRNKRVLMGLGGVAALYIVISLFSSGDDEPVQIEVVEETEVLEPEVFEDLPETKSVSIFAELDEEEPSKTEEDIETLKRQISSINRQNTDFRNQLNRLESKIQTLSSVVEKSVVDLASVVQTQTKEVEKKVEEKQSYKIRAVISGRAWIEDKAGNNMTVKVGDAIPTYGRITKILPVEGVIETSSGRRIMFSHDD